MGDRDDYFGYYQTHKRMIADQAALHKKNMARFDALGTKKQASRSSSASSSSSFSFGSPSTPPTGSGSPTGSNDGTSFDWEGFFEAVIWDHSAWAFSWFDEWISERGERAVIAFLAICAVTGCVMSLFVISFSWQGLAILAASTVGGFLAPIITYFALRISASILKFLAYGGAVIGVFWLLGWIIIWINSLFT